MFDLQALIYSQFITYDRLTGMINESCRDSNANVAHIYIDMQSLLKSIYSNIDKLTIGPYNGLTSCMINMAIHYKYFFLSRYNTTCKIYFVYSNNCPEYCKKWVPNYNARNIQVANHSAQHLEIINQNLRMMKTITPYIDNIYFIETQHETGLAIHHLIQMNMNEKEPHMNFIITKDQYNYQLINNPNTIILRPKRLTSNNNQPVQPGERDISYYINSLNIWSVICLERKIEFNPSILIYPNLVTLVYAISGIKQRGIASTIGIKKCLEIIQNMIISGNIVNNSSYSRFATDMIALIYLNSSKERMKNSSVQALQNTGTIMGINNNYKAIDLSYQYELIRSNSNIYSDLDLFNSYLIDLYDPEGLKNINEQYFKDCPIDLMKL
jgi:hypothetical protein